MALTDIGVRALQPGERNYKRTDSAGLYVEVTPTGSKLWRFKYRHHGKDKRIALGRYPDVGLAEARRKRDEAKVQLANGVDPAAERRHKKLVSAYQAANSFGDIGKEYIEKLTAEGRAETTVSKASWLLGQLGPLSKSPIAELKPLEVFSALKRIEKQGKYETARRCRSFASRVFRYAVATGRAESDPTAALRGALITPKTQHHAALLDPADVSKLLRAIDAYGGRGVTRMALLVAPHVMLRPGELRLAVWPEIDLDRAVWKIPAERMKMRRPHAVPLSRQVVELLNELHQSTGPEGYVFPAFHSWRRPLSENTFNQVFRALGFKVTAHGLRTTASTLLNESGKWSPDAIERSLAHADKDAVRGIYNRGQYWEERVAMHQWWSDYLDALREGDVVEPWLLEKS